MDLGKKLLELRKNKQLSQEEVAEKLNVTKKTISSWETNQSIPNFDKVVPICNLYEISTDELFDNKKIELDNSMKNNKNSASKRALGIVGGILLYFIAVVWLMVSIPFF